MVDKFKDRAGDEADKASDPAKELTGNAIDDQARKAQGTIDQKQGDARREDADGDGGSTVKEALDKLKES